MKEFGPLYRSHGEEEDRLQRLPLMNERLIGKNENKPR